MPVLCRILRFCLCGSGQAISLAGAPQAITATRKSASILPVHLALPCRLAPPLRCPHGTAAKAAQSGNIASAVPYGQLRELHQPRRHDSRRAAPSGSAGFAPPSASLRQRLGKRSARSPSTGSAKPCKTPHGDLPARAPQLAALTRSQPARRIVASALWALDTMPRAPACNPTAPASERVSRCRFAMPHEPLQERKARAHAAPRTSWLR